MHGAAVMSAQRPLQNRVTPFGTIVAIPQRGMLTGNRGIIHDPASKTLLNRRWTSKAWIACSCEYRGRRREVMATRSWTELFFLDEATALAAGHRPCFLCRRQSAEAFQQAWGRATGHAPSAREMDSALHRERLADGQKRVHPLPCPPDELPDGTMVVIEADRPYTIAGGLGFAWGMDGYGEPIDPQHAQGLLTPPSTVAALRAGYRPELHPTLGGTARR